MKHIAVVIRKGVDPVSGLFASGRPQGDWASWVGNSESEVVTHAMEAVDVWEGRTAGHKYEVFVGALTKKVVRPEATYKIVALAEPKTKTYGARVPSKRKGGRK